jgi:cyanophycin synthetase
VNNIFIRFLFIPKKYFLLIYKLSNKLFFRKQRANYQSLRKKYFREYWLNVTSNINASLDDVGYDFFKITKDSKITYVRQSEVMLDSKLMLNMVGNKPLMQKILQDNKFPVPRFLEYQLKDLSSAVGFLKMASCSMVVKPAGGSGGHGITTNVKNEKQLVKASYLASVFDEKLIIEEQIDGSSYRLLYLNNKFIDAVRREPPSVIGNGCESIKTLICNENHRRLNHEKITALSPLTYDLECKLILQKQGLNIRTVLKENEKIYIKSVVNQNSSRDNITVRDDVHSSIITMGEKLSKLLGIELSGVDLITNDISIPLEESNGVINEINTTPGLHHHDLINDEKANVAAGEKIIQYIFSR